MSHYVHQVPGRVRVRARAFRCNPAKTRALGQELRGLPGVYEVRHNDRNGSLTIQYDPASDAGAKALQMLSDAGCLAVSQGETGASGVMAAAFGKAVIAAVAQQTVIRSFNSLAGVVR
jgi:hypothetical protein